VLKVEDVEIQIGNNSPIVEALNFDLSDGEILAVFGPSGCGKSSVLNMIAGFIEPPKRKRGYSMRWFKAKGDIFGQGKVTYKGSELTSLKPNERPIGLVLQKHGVYPHKSAYANIAFPMQCRGDTKNTIARLVPQYSDIVNFPRSKLDQGLRTLSGGEAQRIAIAKMLARRGAIGLMDEPFSHLDQIMRQDLLKVIRDIVPASKGISDIKQIILVSHDWREVKVANKVLLLNARGDSKKSVRVFDVDSKGKNLLPAYSSITDNPDMSEKVWIEGIKSNI